MTEEIESYPILLVCVALDKHHPYKRVLLMIQCKSRKKCKSLPDANQSVVFEPCVSFKQLDAFRGVRTGNNAAVILKPDVVFAFECQS